MSRPASAPQVSFRLQARQRAGYLVAAGILLLLPAASVPSDGVEPGEWLILPVCCLPVALPLVLYYFWSGTFGMTLTPEGVELRGWLTRAYAWPEIEVIYPTTRWFVWRTVLRLTNGAVVYSRAPQHYWSRPDRQFDAKVETIRQWHAYYARAWSTPRRPPRPRRRSPHRSVAELKDRILATTERLKQRTPERRNRSARLAEVSGVSRADVEFAFSVRNRIAHPGRRRRPSRATLEEACDILLSIERGLERDGKLG